MSASSTAALLNKGKKEEKGKFHATVEDDEITIGGSQKESRARAGGNGRRRGAPAPRGNITSDISTHEASASARPASPPTPSMRLSHGSPIASSSKMTLEDAIPRDTVPQPPHAPTTYPIPLPTTPTLLAKGKAKECISPPHGRQSIPSSYSTHQPSPSTRVPTTSTTAAVVDHSDTETEVADDSLSTTATEIAPFLPQLPRRLNLPPRRIPTPPLPPVKVIDFAYRPPPSLAGLPERPVDPRWVVPRVPLPPGCDKVPSLPGVKERWIRQWEAKQDEPGGIYRTGRNRVDGRPNPPPAISLIVTQDGVRGYTSQGWVSPSMKKSGLEVEEERRRKSLKRLPPLKHWKAPEDAARADGRNAAKNVSAAVRRSPAPLIMQPVPRRPALPPQDGSVNPAGTSLSPGKKRRYAETELGTDGDGGSSRLGNAKKRNSPTAVNESEPMDVDTDPSTKARTKAKVDVDAGSSVKPNVKTTSRQKGKTNGHPFEEQPAGDPPPAPRYSLRSHRNGKGKS